MFALNERGVGVARKAKWCRRWIGLIAVLLPLGTVALAQQRNFQPDLNSPQVKTRVEQLLKQMTLQQKIYLLAGHNWMFTRPIKSLGIPSLKMSDGPVGVRSWGPSTAYPASMALAATWDPALAYREGRSIGRDARARGVNIVLGPGINIVREPQCGRNFEYLGEDPDLAGRIAVQWIRGVQSERVAACAKHYAGNEQEYQRHTMSSDIGRRALEEIYLAPFRAAVEQGQVMVIMVGNNRLNGLYCAANPFLLKETLRNRWHFKGMVIPDWRATRSTLQSLKAGLDLEMPTDRYYNEYMISGLLKSRKLSETTIDDHVRNILRVMVAMHFLDRQQLDKSIPLNDPTGAATALEVEREGAVLLKNENHILPLDRTHLHNIVVLGPNASPAVTGGQGSSHTTPIVKPVSMVEGIREAAGKEVHVTAIPYDIKQRPVNALLAASEQQEIKSADVVIACMGPNEGEGHDRPFRMPNHQDEYLQQVAKANPRTIVVINAGDNVAMSSWIHQVQGLLYAWYPGENGNTAVAGILFGTIDPSGRLPVSFAKRWKDAAAYGHYPGSNGHVRFAEGIYVGYRWFDSKHIEPRFPFGYGLSYTTFSIGHMQVRSSGSGAQRTLNVGVTVKNTGPRAGAEIVQLYVRPIHSPVERTFQQLRSFKRVELSPGQTKTVHMLLRWRDFAFFDTRTNTWSVPAGKYELAVGDSSRNIATVQSVLWQATGARPPGN